MIVYHFVHEAWRGANRLSVDGGHRIAGANRAARSRLGLDRAKLDDGVTLRNIFEYDSSLFGRRPGTDFPGLLIFGGVGWPTLVTPPERLAGTLLRPVGGAAIHTRPRRDLLSALRALPTPAARGGLPARTMHRIDEYFEEQLGSSIDLATLAGIAGLSMYHFARQFKQSTGTSPHAYVLQKRLASAAELLANSNLSLAEIAVVTGFSDQSHLTRLFGQAFEMTPGQFRRAQR
jgi:AraC-like DNA-binding protein